MRDPDRPDEQEGNLRKIQDSCAGTRVTVDFEFDTGGGVHARSITTDNGWKISLDRGLDIFQRYEISPFNLVAAVQSERLSKSFEITYIRSERTEATEAEQRRPESAVGT